jgi:hypothetical protein
MRTRRGLLFTVIAGFVAMAFVMSKVDVEGKKITVIEKDTDKEIEVKITDDTEQVVKKKGETTTVKVDLAKLEKGVKRAIDAGKKGVEVKVFHEKHVASKIEVKFGKRAKKAE